jgi:ABC-type lipoprotein export system ATPase subunit
MDIKKITVLGGIGKGGELEPVREIELKMGDIVSIVGPTGCGKTTLINDIELFANENTPSMRKILVNGEVPEFDGALNPVALISQHTNFLSDLPVREFLTIHAGIRQSEDVERTVAETLDFANQLTGEPLILDSPMTSLSGGQTRSLLIADAVVIGNSPIILLDEIENAGIDRAKALELLKNYRKIFVFVTHDPRIALLSDYRIVMGDGAMRQIISTGAEERKVELEIKKMDDLLLDFRALIRAGKQLTYDDMSDRLRAIGYIT